MLILFVVLNSSGLQCEQDQLIDQDHEASYLRHVICLLCCDGKMTAAPFKWSQIVQLILVPAVVLETLFSSNGSRLQIRLPPFAT